MPFNVTQCPACESTFNTNSRVLSAAAGRVRCGACLNVFEAIDNFLVLDEDDGAADQDESVFVGNDPQEYFDPSSFLTRSALRATHDLEAAIEPSIELEPRQTIEQFQPVNERFFATVAEELHGRESSKQTVDYDPDDEPPLDQPLKTSADDADDSIDTAFEETFLDSFTALTSAPADAAESSSTFPEMDAPEYEEAAAPAEEAHDANNDAILNVGLSASFTFDPRARQLERSGETETDLPDDPGTEKAKPTELDAAPEFTPLYAAPQSATEPEEEAKVLEQDAAAFANPGELATEGEPVEEPAIDQPAQTLADATADIDSSILDDALAVEGSADHIIQPESPEFEVESASANELQTHAEIEHDEQTIDTTVTDEEPLSETPQTAAEEVDEDSTEAIRARALEAELNDEEALEAIPRENLLALGSMSTPLEFLARRESRLLRSTLLFLSILILGSLLSAQYLWQRMDLYSQLAQLRPLYEFSCSYLSCELPEFRDIGSIRSENLTVQTHPSFENGLMVNTIIRNTAAFEQPFPVLILSFNSAQNSVIALREFAPAEYLDPGLRSVLAMPPRTPVQIGLAIMDPGPEAVNYTLAFRWP